MKLQVRALRDANFSRLMFFQTGSETYNYRSNYAKIWWGGGGPKVAPNSSATPCVGGTDKRPSKLYADADGSETPFRDEMTGSAPWWFAFEENQDAGNLITKADGTASNAMVVGDQGIVVREFSARLGGVIVLALILGAPTRLK